MEEPSRSYEAFPSTESDEESNYSSSLAPDVAQVVWQKDEAVKFCNGAECSIEFSFLVRKHHCRGCGKIFCHKCSNNWLLLPPERGYLAKTPQRTCRLCFKELSNLDYSKHYEVSGHPEAPTLIVLHEGLTNRKFFQSQIKVWETNLRIIAIDLPGHGSRRGEPLSINGAVELIHKIVEDEVPSMKAVLCGYGLGGYVALAYGKSHPEVCKGLVLCGVCEETFNNNSQLYLGLMRTLYALIPDSLMWSLIPRAYSNLNKQRLDSCLLRSGVDYSMWNECSRVIIEPYYGYYKGFILSIPAPILFINGELEERKSEEGFLRVARDGRLHIIKGASHFFALENEKAEEFEEVLLEFCRDIKWERIPKWKKEMEEIPDQPDPIPENL